MRLPRSLQARLGLSLGILLTVLWIAAASVTAVILRNEMDEVFDAALQETAQRLLPLAVVDIVGREDDGVTQRLATIREHAEFFTYIVRDEDGRILLQSHAADPAAFPDYDGPGFRRTATQRLYNDDALQGTITITVAEPLQHRADVAREIQMGLGLPLLIVVPLALLSIVLAVRASLAPLRRFRDRLEARDARDLSHVPSGDIPSEIAPVSVTLNRLLDRLKSTFDAERSFAASAAHELRTPLAGAIAQAQRLQSETGDPAAGARAADIEATLKRLTRLSERLMQLARAEGGQLRLDRTSDLENRRARRGRRYRANRKAWPHRADAAGHAGDVGPRSGRLRDIVSQPGGERRASRLRRHSGGGNSRHRMDTWSSQTKDPCCDPKRWTV